LTDRDLIELTSMITVERITDIIADHGEGPCWDERSGRVLSVDMFEGAVLSTDPATGETERLPVEGRVAAFVRPVAGGSGFAVAGERDVQLLTDDGSTSLVTLPLPEGVRCNEGSCDPQGRMWVGTLAWDVSPGRGALWRVSGSGDVEMVLDGLTISNGLGWSPEGTVAYFVDSATGRIDRLDFDAERGRLHSRRPFAEIPEADGWHVAPDGLCVDAEGGVWVALVGTGTVRRYDADGSVSTQVDIRCNPVTACAFGGDDLTTMFCTTSRYDGAPDEPNAGALFAFPAGVTGLPVNSFGLPSSV